MNRLVRKVIDKISDVLSYPRPSLLDLVVCLGVIPIGYITREFQGLYLIFYTFFIYAVSLSRGNERHFRSFWLSLIIIWSFFGIFIHSWLVNSDTVSYKYLNFYLMSEGFLYVFAGIMYFHVIVTKCRNLRLLWVTIPIALIPLINKQIYCGQMSYILALFIGIMVYALMRKNKVLGIVMLAGAVVVCVSNIDWLIMKFQARPYVWTQLLREIFQYPLFGTGFNKSLTPNNFIWVEQIGTLTFGWLFRHNDYLSISGFLGLPILIPITGFLVQCYQEFKNSWKIILFVSFVVVSFFQMTMFEAYKAYIILTIMAYMVTER